MHGESGPKGHGSENAGHVAGQSAGFEEHPDRASVLHELHARPFLSLKLPRRVYHYAFMTDGLQAAHDRQAIGALALSRGAAAPDPGARFHHFDFGPWHLRWEQHAEFTTYTWSTSRGAEKPFTVPDPVAAGEIAFEGPGPLISAVHLALVVAGEDSIAAASGEDRQNRCVIEAADGSARVSSDFMVDASGMTRILVESTGLTETRAGRLVQRLLEIETYRTLALLGLPVARSIRYDLDRTEEGLAAIVAEISRTENYHESQALLRWLGTIAADLEAQAARTAYRFAATRAYYDIVRSRLEVIRERPYADHVTITAFFNRRLKPAIETCNAVERRQQRLSSQLARATDLLSTGIQSDLERQNRDLLEQMNKRARMQLMLQQTVEGLSVAAISYYVVGLIGYVSKGLAAAGVIPEKIAGGIVMAAAVPIVIGAVWFGMRSIHKRLHSADHADDDAAKKD